MCSSLEKFSPEPFRVFQSGPQERYSRFAENGAIVVGQVVWFA